MTRKNLGGMVEESHPRCDDLGSAPVRQGIRSKMGARAGMRRVQVYREAQSGYRYWLSLIAVILFVWAACARAQEAGSGATPPSDQKTNPTNPPEQTGKVSRSDAKTEVATKDTNTTFKLRVNLVQVRVVVRDENGKPVEHLSREDFQIYDQGKPQVISTFGTETPESRRDKAEAAAKTQAGAVSEKENALVAMPQRFVALVFDDIHLSNSDATFVRVSAKALIESMTPTDRMGIYSTSGEVTQEFTSDKDALERRMMGVTAHPMTGTTNSATNCPDVSHYMADLA